MKKINFNNVTLEMSAGRPDQFPTSGLPTVAMSGRSNVGKSSLINKFLKRKNLVRVSQTPGKTITVNFFNVDKAFYVADLPGYGYAKRTPTEKKALSAITDAFFTNNKGIGSLKLVLQLIDPRAGVTADDSVMLDFLNQMEIPYAVVLTKMDKLNKTESIKVIEEISANPYILESEEIFGRKTEIIPFSALKLTGLDDINRIILNAIK